MRFAGLFIVVSYCVVDSSEFTGVELESAFLHFANDVISVVNFQCNLLKPFREFVQKPNVRADNSYVMLYSGGRMLPFSMANASAALAAHPDFAMQARTMIYAHGFNGDPDSEEVLRLGALLRARGHNLLTLDSEHFLDGVNYVYISGLAEYVGELLHGFVADMVARGLPVDKLHLVGHSMGAQIAGYAARRLNATRGLRVPRLTGLDPASPCFERPGVDCLSKTDAARVDVVYTSVLSYRPNADIGHVQYFVNGRYPSQPGCQGYVPCSHSRSRYLFVESVENATAFPALRCSDINSYTCQMQDLSTMGYHWDMVKTGNYLLHTKDKSPFGMGMLGL